jgi:hypothetical protein
MNNVGYIDRIIRITIAATLLILHLADVIPENLIDSALVVSMLLVFTSLRKCCPLYALLGFGTCTTSYNGKKTPRIKTKKLDI